MENTHITKNTQTQKDILKINQYEGWAKRAQEVVFKMHRENLQEMLPASFIFELPRLNASGDFYYVQVLPKNRILIIVGDAPGYGIMGAFLHLVVDRLVTECLHQDEIHAPNEILKQLNTKLNNDLNAIVPLEEKAQIKMSVCVIDEMERTLTFAGAKQRIAYVQKGEIKETRGSMYAVGTQMFAEKEAPEQTIDLELGTTHVYLFTDGFQDQFGGSEGKRFMRKQLRDLFLQVHQEHIPTQKQQIKEAFNHWKGNENQVDDVLVLGFKLD
ncbi:SpoIIE family protein phosphatase [uncultured Microscilla sp.]|uniref:PP2C family protein-serine/threonine phosphatase n=1 Tax=uncultured Microscilla sp. TaxID=432653 RepID=UPI0026273D23|nr:SpoIIE family protein phosphatase [uncultured Microscilla sp.]